jgi:REP element-mobilizing transposase RayT
MLVPYHDYRKNTRLQSWDYYDGGWYYITICTSKHAHLFGDVVDGNIILRKAGLIAHECWLRMADIYDWVELDEFIVMPNHIHGILAFTGRSEKALGALIGAYKSIATKEIRRSGCAEFAWQPNFFDRIIRDEWSLGKIREYIRNNPAQWELEKDAPENIGDIS